MTECKNCQHSEYDPRTAPVLWCVRHGDQATSPCVQFVREPGADDEEGTTK